MGAGGTATFHEYVCLPPGVVMDPEATKTTGLTAEFLAENGRPFEEAYPRFVSFLRQQVEAAGAGAYLVLIGHNIKGEDAAAVCCCSCVGPQVWVWSLLPFGCLAAAFDFPKLHRQANSTGLPLLRHARFLDTSSLARVVFPSPGEPGQPKDRKLETLYTFFSGERPDVSHRAVEDCRSNLLVLQHLLRDLLQLPGRWTG